MIWPKNMKIADFLDFDKLFDLTDFRNRVDRRSTEYFMPGFGLSLTVNC